MFYSKSPEYGWLSNFSEHGFNLDGVWWASVEHYYQAQKYPGTDAAVHIRKAESPAKARKAGQDRSLVPRADWEAVKEEVPMDRARSRELSVERGRDGPNANAAWRKPAVKSGNRSGPQVTGPCRSRGPGNRNLADPDDVFGAAPVGLL